ncbi:PLP-dependent aminotransferase family protein [Leptospira sarikeiensis]|uniref:PLP-dependent aminotransferase family protein n=1 Tax=Leptospira sarikeiensis TaxID=2484943 RepID=A0A4R9KC07_9LEPT|nr:PLP-dependent aminotransferase family protein [Leptospira sarikeiensis]TGL63329.1 PLP-dependent aminotransferase family protein [Leptospira sarikeiensis]
MGKLILETKRNLFKPANRIERTPSSVTREILKVIDTPGMISFAGGLPDDSLFPIQEFSEIFADSISKKGPKLFQYSDTQGHSELRAWIAGRYYPNSSPDEILLTAGSQQALDILARYFIEDGSNILLERPSYLGAIQVFSSYNPFFLGIDYEEEGPDPEKIKYILEHSSEDLKFFYTIPDFQNPSGRSYSIQNREIISKYFYDHKIPILEDTAYRELSFENHIPISLCELGPEHTISIGTFSKTLAPGLRVGWIRAPKSIVKDLIVQKQSIDLHSPSINQELVFQFVSSSKYEKHLSLIRETYKRKSDFTFNCLKERFEDSIPLHSPQGGLFYWIEFPKEIDTDILFKKCLEKGLAAVPGSSFFINEAERNRLRWNFSNATKEETKLGAERLFNVYKEIRSEK